LSDTENPKITRLIGEILSKLWDLSTPFAQNPSPNFSRKDTQRGKPQPKRAGLALKLQITKYKLQKNRSQVMLYEMLFKKGFPGCDQKILAKKTRN
jgi:hypothetical protein